MARILSVDYGMKRSGIAVTDPMQIIANGLATVDTAQLFSFLVEYTRKEQVELIIIGYARKMSGEDSDSMTGIKKFVNKWRSQMPGIPVDFYDERFTSVLAHKAMLDGGLRKKQRQNKALVDMISATIILQSYLESKRI